VSRQAVNGVNHLKIVLDAGHGYDTPGKRSPDGMKEYEFNRMVANYAKKLLSQYKNVEVYFTHSDVKDIPLQTRTKQANALKANLLISIHANASGSGGWNSAEGIETFIHTRKPAEAVKLANSVHKNLILATRLKDRGVKTANFHVLRETTMPSILIECGFMTNKEEIKLLRSDSYRQKCAEAIVKGIAEAYGLEKVNAVSSPLPPQENGLYKVQVGAFNDKKNADFLAEQLKKAGYKAMVIFEKK
jgi:N-acetylmuramoyl-L-alanine amidase